MASFPALPCREKLARRLCICHLTTTRARAQQGSAQICIKNAALQSIKITGGFLRKVFVCP